MQMTFLTQGISVRYNRLVKVLETKEDLGTAFYNIRDLEKLGIQVVYEKFATLRFCTIFCVMIGPVLWTSKR